MPNLVATKSMVYATRRLLPGDVFQASNMDARILLAIKKAKLERVPGAIEAPPRPIVVNAPNAAGDDALTKLRADYAEAVGKRAYHGWGAAELQRRIDEALAS